MTLISKCLITRENGQKITTIYPTELQQIIIIGIEIELLQNANSNKREAPSGNVSHWKRNFPVSLCWCSWQQCTVLSRRKKTGSVVVFVCECGKRNSNRSTAPRPRTSTKSASHQWPEIRNEFEFSRTRLWHCRPLFPRHTFIVGVVAVIIVDVE